MDSASPDETKLLEATLATVAVRRAHHPGHPRRYPDRLIADRGYDSNRLRAVLAERGIEPIIPAQRNHPHTTHQDGRRLGRYRHRWIVEGMPDRECYVDSPESMRTIRAQCLAHLARVLALVHVPDAGPRASRIVELERSIAEVHTSREESVSIKKGNIHWSRAAFDTRAPGTDWTAFLQPPFFDPRSPAALDYGNPGTTLGHEISHGFDDQGAPLDATGRLSNWWTDEDLAHFKAAAVTLAEQSSAYQPFSDAHVNGQ